MNKARTQEKKTYSESSGVKHTVANAYLRTMQNAHRCSKPGHWLSGRLWGPGVHWLLGSKCTPLPMHNAQCTPTHRCTLHTVAVCIVQRCVAPHPVCIGSRGFLGAPRGVSVPQRSPESQWGKPSRGLGHRRAFALGAGEDLAEGLGCTSGKCKTAKARLRFLSFK